MKFNCRFQYPFRNLLPTRTTPIPASGRPHKTMNPDKQGISVSSPGSSSLAVSRSDWMPEIADFASLDGMNTGSGKVKSIEPGSMVALKGVESLRYIASLKMSFMSGRTVSNDGRAPVTYSRTKG